MDMKVQDLAQRLRKTFEEWGGGDIGWQRIAEQFPEIIRKEFEESRSMGSIEIEGTFELHDDLDIMVTREPGYTELYRISLGMTGNEARRRHVTLLLGEECPLNSLDFPEKCVWLQFNDRRKAIDIWGEWSTKIDLNDYDVEIKEV
jgi:hypothetical protein